MFWGSWGFWGLGFGPEHYAPTDAQASDLMISFWLGLLDLGIYFFDCAATTKPLASTVPLLGWHTATDVPTTARFLPF